MEEEIKPWYFLIEPFPKESISHFLGRFRRENQLSVSRMGQVTNLGGAIARWEKFRFNPPPVDKELEQLSELVQIEVIRLREMLPSQGTGMKMSPIRLCGACYGENPYHQMVWQFKSSDRCHQHQLTLLSECPNCGARFKIPSLWEYGWCHRCFSPFEEMMKFQKSL